MIIIKCPTCGAETHTADKVSICGLYDCHLVHMIQGRTVDEVIDNWLGHNCKPHFARFEHLTEPADLGKSALCPAIVTSNGKDLRRVGKMVFVGDDHVEQDLEAYRSALLDDPDIPRLLAERKAK